VSKSIYTRHIINKKSLVRCSLAKQMPFELHKFNVRFLQNSMPLVISASLVTHLLQ